MVCEAGGGGGGGLVNPRRGLRKFSKVWVMGKFAGMKYIIVSIHDLDSMFVEEDMTVGLQD